MRLPSKVTPYGESSLPGMVFVMELLEKAPARPKELLEAWKSAGFPMEEFAGVLDALFAIGKVGLSDSGKVTAVAQRDSE